VRDGRTGGGTALDRRVAGAEVTALEPGEGGLGEDGEGRAAPVPRHAARRPGRAAPDRTAPPPGPDRRGGEACDQGHQQHPEDGDAGGVTGPAKDRWGAHAHHSRGPRRRALGSGANPQLRGTPPERRRREEDEGDDDGDDDGAGGDPPSRAAPAGRLVDPSPHDGTLPGLRFQ